MKRLVVALVLIFALIGMAQAVPYPYGEYTLPEGDPETVEGIIKGEYTVPAQSEDDGLYPWVDLSFAVLDSPALSEAEVNRRAEFEFWSDAEKAEELEKAMTIHENRLSISLALLTDMDVDHGYRYTDTTGSLSFIDRIILETSDGRRIQPANVFGGDSNVVAGYWMSVSILSFPRYVDGEQIISEDTEWMKLWIISGTNRIYFRFDFD